MEPRILLYDIEITPTLAWVYGHFDTNVLEIEREPYIMCFAYRWFGERTTKVVALTDFKGYYENDPYDDYAVVSRLHELMDEADVVVAHNAKQFDNKVANERFLYHGLPPVAPYQTIDTRLESRKYFRQGTHSLDRLCHKLGIGNKPKERHSDLWRACVRGDATAWQKMKRYCKHDVDLLERLYLRLRPFMATHPTRGSGQVCHNCGSTHLQSRGVSRTRVNTYKRFQCQDCGAWHRERLATGDKASVV